MQRDLLAEQLGARDRAQWLAEQAVFFPVQALAAGERRVGAG
jgi:hypothetical protein